MTGLLSAISGNFSKSIILGFFAPSVIFVILWRLLIEPLFPAGHSPFLAFEKLSTEWDVLGAAFAAIVISLLLYNLNIPLIRFLEGYPWRYSWIGKWRTGVYKARYRQAQARYRGLRALYRKLDDPSGLAKEGEQERIGRIRDIYQQQTIHGFPDREDLILPTRLGNVIRSGEYYPDMHYHMDAVTLWPRLVAVIPSGYAAAIQDAETAFDFMISNAGLMSVLGLVSFLLGLLFAPENLGGWIAWMLQVVLFSLLAYGSYVFSIGRAAAWFSLVQGAFDLYRGELLKKLGYEEPITDREQERTHWDDISFNMIYGYDEEYPPLPYKSTEAETDVTSSLKEADLNLTRSFELDANGKIEWVVIVLTNPTPSSIARQVVVSESVPAGYAMVWDSASLELELSRPYPRLRRSARGKRRPHFQPLCSARGKRKPHFQPLRTVTSPGRPAQPGSLSLQVTGTNPYKFTMPDLSPGQHAKLRYRIAPLSVPAEKSSKGEDHA